MRGERLTPAELRALTTAPKGTAFSPYEQLFAHYDNGLVFSPDDWSAQRLSAALEADGQLRSVEQVLTLPIRSASWEIVPEADDAGQAAFVLETMRDKLPLLINQATSAIGYRRAFFETTWTLDQRGRVVYDELAMRPAVGCDPGFDPKTSKPKGFRQRQVPIAGIFSPTWNTLTSSTMPGYDVISPERSFVYVHGTHREPIRGVSELDVALWIHETKKKIVFLASKFLEKHVISDVLFFGEDQEEADERAAAWANLGASGAMGLERRSGDTEKAVFAVLDSGGRGGGEFLAFLNWLNSEMTASVLAGFTDLPQAAAQGTGSYALSADQSEFFLAASQARADELADAIRRDVFGPLVAYNWGPHTSVPRLKIGPLSSAYQQRGIDLLKVVVNSRFSNIPRGVVEQLISASASYLGLDPARVNNAIDQAEREMLAAQAQTAALAAQQQAAVLGRGGADGLPEPGLFPADTAWQDTQPRTTTLPANLPPALRSVGLAVNTMHGLVTDQLRSRGELVAA